MFHQLQQTFQRVMGEELRGNQIGIFLQIVTGPKEGVNQSVDLRGMPVGISGMALPLIGVGT